MIRLNSKIALAIGSLLIPVGTITSLVACTMDGSKERPNVSVKAVNNKELLANLYFDDGDSWMLSGDLKTKSDTELIDIYGESKNRSGSITIPRAFRLIGVDTPEVLHHIHYSTPAAEAQAIASGNHDSLVTTEELRFGNMATDVAHKWYMDNKENAYMTKLVDSNQQFKIDKFGRGISSMRLASEDSLSSGNIVNDLAAELIYEGLGVKRYIASEGVYFYPNEKYINFLTSTELSAMVREVGIWKDFSKYLHDHNSWKQDYRNIDNMDRLKQSFLLEKKIYHKFLP